MKNFRLIIASLGIIALLLTCQKLDFDLVTKVKTTSIKTGMTSIEVKGEIVELSKDNHNEYGFCYGTDPEPTINDMISTLNNPQKGEFTKTITGLTSDTKYYIRSYCQEGDSYVYGEVAEAKTSITTLTDFDNNTYNAVAIGTQVWMQENLKVTHYQNGDPIESIPDNTLWSNAYNGAYCWCNNDVGNKSEYGGLYNYYTVNNSRNVCPVGWHVPSADEWTTLIQYLGGEEIAGGKMKEFGLLHWISPNTNATNSSGFSAIPSGYRYVDGAFNSFGEESKWWSTTSYDYDNSAMCYIYNSYATVFRENFQNKNGLSIRCVQD